MRREREIREVSEQLNIIRILIIKLLKGECRTLQVRGLFFSKGYKKNPFRKPRTTQRNLRG